MSSPTRAGTTWSGTWSCISGRSSFGFIPWSGGSAPRTWRRATPSVTLWRPTWLATSLRTAGRSPGWHSRSPGRRPSRGWRWPARPTSSCGSRRSSGGFSAAHFPGDSSCRLCSLWVLWSFSSAASWSQPPISPQRKRITPSAKGDRTESRRCERRSRKGRDAARFESSSFPPRAQCKDR